MNSLLLTGGRVIEPANRFDDRAVSLPFSCVRKPSAWIECPIFAIGVYGAGARPRAIFGGDLDSRYVELLTAEAEHIVEPLTRGRSPGNSKTSEAAESQNLANPVVEGAAANCPVYGSRGEIRRR